MCVIKRILVSFLFLAFSTSSVLANEGKTLTIGIEPSLAPFDFTEKNSPEVKGFDVDIINSIAEVEGYKVVIKILPFDALLPAVLTEQVDVAISGYAITEEKAQIVQFEPYYESGLGILVRKDLSDKIKSSYDLVNHTICTKSGNIGTEYAEKLPNANIRQYNTAIDAFVGLDKGECDLVIIEKPVIEYYMVSGNQGDSSVINNSISFEQYGIVTSKSNHKASKIISHGLSVIKENGVYDQIYQKWFKH